MVLMCFVVIVLGRLVVVLLCLSTGRSRRLWLISLLLVLILKMFWFRFASMMSPF
jgi:hypothetical protein